MPAADTVKIEIAATAARLVVEEGMEYGPAKQRALKVLGLGKNHRAALPSNDLLEDEVRDYLAIFCADTQPAELLALRGVGPWTADYLQMRGRSDPDAFVPGDLVARRALNRISEREAVALAVPWAPYRSYAMVHLWASDSVG